MRDVGRKQRHHVGAETLGDDDGRIVSARPDALDRFVLADEDPVEAVVGAQRRHDGVAHVDVHGRQVAFVARVLVRNCDLEPLGMPVRIPAAGDIEPCVHRRHEHQAHEDDDADDVLHAVAHVADEDPQDVACDLGRALKPRRLHRAPPFSSEGPGAPSDPKGSTPGALPESKEPPSPIPSPPTRARRPASAPSWDTRGSTSALSSDAKGTTPCSPPIRERPPASAPSWNARGSSPLNRSSCSAIHSDSTPARSCAPGFVEAVRASTTRA